MSYVDGFVMPIPKKNMKAYLRMARDGKRLWMKNGALNYMECVGDDLKPAFGAKFPKMTRLKRNETIIFAFIVFKSRAHRDRVNAKVMKDMAAMGEQYTEMPFDPRRMAYGGFRTIVSA